MQQSLQTLNQQVLLSNRRAEGGRSNVHKPVPTNEFDRVLYEKLNKNLVFMNIMAKM